jgi:predicted DNA-binding transcriptional regulator AlpA
VGLLPRTVRDVELEELAGLAEVAMICGVAKPTALRYSKRDDFPLPLGRLASGPVWRRADIERWALDTLPLRVGRPSTLRSPDSE